MKKSYLLDIHRLDGHKGHRYEKLFCFLFRLAKESRVLPLKHLYRLFFHIHAFRRNNEIFSSTEIGYGFCLWHAYNITVASDSIIGNNVTLNKGCMIGREMRGERHGAPIIGDNVFVGANAVIVGKVKVGNNVLIAPNSYVNCDVPSDSIVLGNPCIIKHSNDATAHYIQNPIDIDI